MLRFFDKLVVRPIVMEFGHELFTFQGFIRYLVKRYHIKEVEIYGKRGHELLYEDFCCRYIAHDIESIEVSGPFWACGTDQGYELNPNRGYVIHNIFEQSKNRKFYKQIFLPLGTYSRDLSYDILLHVRNLPIKTNDCIDRNFGQLDDFIRFASLVKGRIGSVGGGNSLHVPGTDDLRGITLKKLADIYRSSKVIVGSVSGPIHFAALCSLPQITWSGIPESRERCERGWNPFGSPVHFIDSNNFPQKNILRCLNDWQAIR